MSPGSSSDGDSDLLGCYAVSTGESYRCFEELWCLSSGWSILETCLFEYEPESTRLIRKFRLYQSTVCDILEYMNHKKVFHCSRTFYSPVRRRNSSFGLVITRKLWAGSNTSRDKTQLQTGSGVQSACCLVGKVAET